MQLISVQPYKTIDTSRVTTTIQEKTNLFVDGIPYHWTEEQVNNLFEKYGPIKSTRMKKPLVNSEESKFMIQ